MHFKYNFLTLSVMESKMELKWWGGEVIAPATSTTQNFLHKIVIKFLGHKNQNWHCWSPFSKQLVQSTPPHPPITHRVNAYSIPTN